MGLAASQARYLALTARKSDLEYQSQTINTRRIQLAYKTAEVARRYSEGMNNQIIAISHDTLTENGKTTQAWEELTFSNLVSNGYAIIGINGGKLDPAPYQTVAKEKLVYTPRPGETISKTKFDSLSSDNKIAYEVHQETTPSDKYITDDEYNKLSTTTEKNKYKTLYKESISKEDYEKLEDGDKENYENIGTDKDPKYVRYYTEDEYNKATEATKKTWEKVHQEQKTVINYKLRNDLSESEFKKLDDEYRNMFTESEEVVTELVPNPSYGNSDNATDLQSLLVSGRAQIVTQAFFNYLCAHGYSYHEGLSPEQYAEVLDLWESDKKANPDGQHSVVDWRSDETSTFKQRNYTEDDADVLAEYEAATAEIQAQDKILEVEEKNIETQHKAIETEMESVKKVIQKNMEETFKIFS